MFDYCYVIWFIIIIQSIVSSAFCQEISQILRHLPSMHLTLLFINVLIGYVNKGAHNI